MKKLKLCPFCGGKAEITEVMGESWIYCTKCYVATSMLATRGLAIEAWDTRNESEPCENCEEWQALQASLKWLICCPTCGREL